MQGKLEKMQNECGQKASWESCDLGRQGGGCRSGGSRSSQAWDRESRVWLDGCGSQARGEARAARERWAHAGRVGG